MRLFKSRKSKKKAGAQRQMSTTDWLANQEKIDPRGKEKPDIVRFAADFGEELKKAVRVEIRQKKGNVAFACVNYYSFPLMLTGEKILNDFPDNLRIPDVVGKEAKANNQEEITARILTAAILLEWYKGKKNWQNARALMCQVCRQALQERSLKKK